MTTRAHRTVQLCKVIISVTRLRSNFGTKALSKCNYVDLYSIKVLYYYCKLNLYTPLTRSLIREVVCGKDKAFPKYIPTLQSRYRKSHQTSTLFINLSKGVIYLKELGSIKLLDQKLIT